MASSYLFTSMLALELAESFGQCSKVARAAEVTAEARFNKIHESRNRARRLFFPHAKSGQPALVDVPSSTERERR
jgi:hypothetical protein